MATQGPSRRLLQPSTFQCLHSHHPSCTYTHPTLTTRRLASNRNNNAGPKISNPVLDEYMKKAPSTRKQDVQRGDLASSSIFDTERRVQERETDIEETTSTVTVGGEKRNAANMAAILDPRPRQRERWQRKMVIREIQRGGRLSRAEFIKRTERENTVKSPNFKTSVKKLGPLARQITGKSIEEAITQMRFSKKKVAKEVLEHLEFARDEAVVKTGMGLGGVRPQEAEEGIDAAVGTKKQRDEGREIQLKDGKRHLVADLSKIYIDQAFVGRGPYGQLPDYRARGRVYIMRTPWTHLTVKLKEEATRVREYQEREAKRQRERLGKVWTALPDRPIQGQRQWYSW